MKKVLGYFLIGLPILLIILYILHTEGIETLIKMGYVYGCATLVSLIMCYGLSLILDN